MTLHAENVERTRTGTTSVRDLRAEHLPVAFGIGTATPRLSWRVHAEEEGWSFDQYEIELARADGSVETVVVRSPEQVLVPWPFAPLASRERVIVRVRVGNGREWTDPSDPLPLEVGLLHPSDWTARMISPITLGGLDDGAPVIFRDIMLPAEPVDARLYVSAHGIYEFEINGQRVGEDLFTPGWTAYQHRLRYQTYNVTGLLSAGRNELQGMLGNGWYRGQLVWPGNRSSYGDRLSLIAQLEVRFADGTVRTVATDENWEAAAGSIIFDDLYDGQLRDLRLSDHPAGRPAEPVEVVPSDLHRLVAADGPPVRVTEVLPAHRVFESPLGKTLVDFGQNLVGWVRLRVRGRAGDEVTIRHAEVLENGELGIRPLRSAKATSTYILAGAQEEVLQPTFTFNGFRYAEISGVNGVRLEDVEALVLGSDLERTGWFECSDPRINQLHSNVVWSTRGNFLDLPTDCPQRDERLGWTGDIQVFAPTANFLFNTAGFLAGWLRDLAAEQKPDGGVPYVIPDVLRDADPAAAAWSDAATIVPDSLYTAFADRGVLERQYKSMTAWIEKVKRIAGSDRLWASGFQFGDWLDPTAPPDDAAQAQADPHVVATAYFARSASTVARTAALLGHDDDAVRYRELAGEVRRAFIDEYVAPDGTIRSDCQTVYALAIAWDLLGDDRQARGAGERLATLVRHAHYRVSTGFVGTPLILSALSKAGHIELAHRMLVEEECPSWLYAVGMGATTVWERWDSMLPDGSINPGSMTSFNHYAYGAVAEWLHTSVAGLAPAAPGCREVEVRPLVTGSLSHASARHRSPYGDTAVSWLLDAGDFTLAVELPYGTTARVWLPGATESLRVGRGHHIFAIRYNPENEND